MKKTLILFLALSAIVACTKQETPSGSDPNQPGEQTDTTITPPVVDPEPVVIPKYYSIPDEFKECEFVAFVNSGSTCKSIITASGWEALSDSLEAKAGQSIALVALGKGSEYAVEPQTPGQTAKTYSVIPVKKVGMPAIWSCQATADSANTADFVPVQRTFRMHIGMTNTPSDLESVEFTIKQQAAVNPASPGIYSGTEDITYTFPVSELGQSFNFMPMQSASKELYLVLNFNYKDKMRDCMIHLNKRASARYSVEVNLDMEEKDLLDVPELTISGTDADGNALENYQKMSLWNHSLTPATGFVKNDNFKIHCGTNKAFLFGSGCSWKYYIEDTDNDIPWMGFDVEQEVVSNAKIGFDHFRLPVDEVCLMYSDCTPRPIVTEKLKEVIDLSIQNNVKIILDLHWLYVSQTFPNAESEAHYRVVWKYLHDNFKDYPTDMLAYELINEPNSPKEYWNFFMKNSIDMVRDWGGLEKDRIIFCSCNNGGDYVGTNELELPSDTDPNLVMTYHDYFPTYITFYDPGSIYRAVYINYPGDMVPEDEYEKLSDVQKSYIPYNMAFHKSDLVGTIETAARNGERLGVPVYVGEYGCQGWVPIESRRNYFTDKCSLFNKHKMSYANWFGLGTTRSDAEPDSVIYNAIFDITK